MNGYKYNKYVYRNGMRYNEFKAHQIEATKWCEGVFGKNKYRWHHSSGCFHFNDEKDYMLFLLRWS
jgi:hypothetical protein